MKFVHNNPKLSLKAKGLYYELSNGDLNTVSQKDFPKVTKDGMTAVESAYRELYRNGLLKMHRGKNGTVRYILLKPDVNKNKDVAKLIMILLRDNHIVISKRRKFYNKVYKMVQSGCTFNDFSIAVTIMYDVKNLLLSSQYRSDYEHGKEHIKPYVNSPWSYVIHIVDKGQLFADLDFMEGLVNSYIKPKPHRTIKKLSKLSLVPNNWVDKDRLHYINFRVYGTPLYLKYFGPKAKN